MKEEPLLLLSDLQKLINQVVLIDYTIIILGYRKWNLILTKKWITFNVFDMIILVMENNNFTNMDFEMPSEVLDKIQENIQDIIKSFDIPDDNKMDVIKNINFMYTQTKHLSETDALTRLSNRRCFESNFDREFARSKRYGNNLSVAVVDIDFFKKINDT